MGVPDRDDDERTKRRAERGRAIRRAVEREALRSGEGKQSLVDATSSSSTQRGSSSPGKRSLVEANAAPALTEVEQHAHLMTAAKVDVTAIRSSALPALLQAIQRKDLNAIAQQSVVLGAGHRVQYMMLVAEQRVQALCNAGLSGDPAVALLRSELAALKEQATQLGVYRGAAEPARAAAAQPKSALDTHGLGALGKTQPAPVKQMSPQDQLVDMKATAHAAALVLARPTTNDRRARMQFLNTLDRIDDPVLRAKTLEKFQAQTGMPLRVFIRSTEWHSDRDEEQALTLISPRRDAAERELQAMTPADRKKLAAEAAGWSQEILQVTRSDDANSDDNTSKITRVLGMRSPAQIEAIRASVRTNTRDKSLYQEIDRSLSGGNEDEALAGVKGDPVFAAFVGIENADGNAARVKEILHDLKDKRLDLAKGMGPVAVNRFVSSLHESQRVEVRHLLTGSDAAANGAHFADLFKDPKAGLEVDGAQVTQQSQQNFEARNPENVLKELRSKSPAEIAAARSAWDLANPGRSWDQMIQERFGDGDPATFLRINALAHGNKVEERAYALRDGIRKNNQAQIEAALANPDLTSKDPAKQAAAEAEKRQLQIRVRELDALGQRATALMTGQDPTRAAGRDLDAQLADHYADAIAKNPKTVDMAELIELSADPEGTKNKRKVRAGEDTYATDELKTQGSLSTTTQIRRAETKGDTQRRAELLENLESSGDLTKVRTQFHDRYNKDVLEEPNLAKIDAAAEFLKSTGDSRPLSEIKKSVAQEAQTSNQLRVEHVRNYGVKAERSDHLQHILQKDLYAKQHSDSLEESENLRERYGGNTGSEDLVRSQLAVQDEMFTTPTGPFGTGSRELKPSVERDDLKQLDKNLTQSLDTQREEKLKHAERLANAYATIAKIGALLVAQPELFALIDIAAGLGAMTIKRAAGGSDVDLTTDTKMLAVTAIIDTLTLGLARIPGAGTALNAERAAQSAAQVGEKTATELVEHGVTTEAKTEIAGARFAAGESRLMSKGLNPASAESGAAQLAKAETGALALVEGKAANEGVSAGTTVVTHGKLVANVVVSGAGAVAGEVVQGGTTDDLLLALTRTLLGTFLPGHLAGSMQKAIGTGSKVQRAAGAALGTVANAGTNYAISGDAIDAIGNGIQHHAGGPSHSGDDHHAPRRTSHESDTHPAARHADESAHPAARHADLTDGPDAVRRPAHDSETTPRSHDEAHASDRDHESPGVRAMRQLTPAERAAVEQHIRKYGHPGSELHSHFLGIASIADFAKQMGTADGKPLTNEQMLARMQTAVRNDADFAKHYSRDEQGTQVFDYSGAGRSKKGGHAFENVKVIEAAQAGIDKLRKLPPSPEHEARIQQLAETAVREAMETSQRTPFDGAYSIRDSLVKAYIDPQGESKTPYKNYTRMALAALTRDGVHYSEQSQSVGKLAKGNFPEGLLKEVNEERAKNGEPPMTVRFLAMLETRYLGEQGSDAAGTATEWGDQLRAAREVMTRGDVLGLDFAAPETTTMAKGGAQLQQRFREAAEMLRDVGKDRGRKLVLRPHVGEGYVEMPIDPKTGRPMEHDRDHNRDHYQKAQDNMRALVDAVDAMTKPGPKGEPPLYDPNNPAFDIRFGHATHASPEIAADMKRLGIVAEVNLGSNVMSGSLQDNPTNPAGRDHDGRLQSLDDHSLLTLAAAGVPIVLSTDAQGVMNTTLANEYIAAKEALDRFRGGSDQRERALGQSKIPVTRETYLNARPDVDRATAKPPFELGYAELPEVMKRNIDTAFERMIADAAERKHEVETQDADEMRPSEGKRP